MKYIVSMNKLHVENEEILLKLVLKYKEKLSIDEFMDILCNIQFSLIDEDSII